MTSWTFYTVRFITSTSLWVVRSRRTCSLSGSSDEQSQVGWVKGPSVEPSPVITINAVATGFAVPNVNTIATQMTSRTFCTQALTNTGHLFIRTFQRIDRPLVWAVVSRRTRETCRLMVLVIKRSRFTFEFKPETFGTKGTAIATKRLDSTSIAIISRRTDERFRHDLMRAIKSRFTRYAFKGRIVASTVCTCAALKRVF